MRHEDHQRRSDRCGPRRARCGDRAPHGVGGWCPKAGWAEDLPNPPGLLAKYPKLKETPQSNPLQRTEWNVRDSDAALVITDGGGMAVSIGTGRAHRWAHQHGKPELVVVRAPLTSRVSR